MSDASLLETLDAHLKARDFKMPFERTRDNLLEQARVRTEIEDKYGVYPLTNLIFDRITDQEMKKNLPEPATRIQNRLLDGYGKLVDRAAGLVVARKVTIEEMGPKIKEILAAKALEEGLITEADCEKLGMKFATNGISMERVGGYRQVVAGK